MERYNILSGKNCFLTGATGGIGREIAKNFAANGCNLFLTSRTSSKLSADMMTACKALFTMSVTNKMNYTEIRDS